MTTAETTLSEARQAIWDMRATSVASGNGLADRLERAARDLIGVAPIAIDFAVAGERRALPRPIEDEMCYVGREAIANAVKHGPPCRLVASLVYEPGAVRLTVRDDGPGFDVQESSFGGGHFGLLGMRERARRIGADLTINSHPGKGTTVVLVLPRA